jgi:hypothetical protein
MILLEKSIIIVAKQTIFLAEKIFGVAKQTRFVAELMGFPFRKTLLLATSLIKIV